MPGMHWGSTRPCGRECSRSESREEVSRHAGQRILLSRTSAYVPGDREAQPSGSTSSTKLEPPQRGKQPKTTSEPVASPFRAAPKVDASGRNPDLDSFEKVMEAMEAELARAKSQSGSSQPPKTRKTEAAQSTARSSASANPLPPLPTEADLDAMDEDD